MDADAYEDFITGLFPEVFSYIDAHRKEPYKATTEIKHTRLYVGIKKKGQQLVAVDREPDGPLLVSTMVKPGTSSWRNSVLYVGACQYIFSMKGKR